VLADCENQTPMGLDVNFAQAALAIAAVAALFIPVIGEAEAAAAASGLAGESLFAGLLEQSAYRSAAGQFARYSGTPWTVEAAQSITEAVATVEETISIYSEAAAESVASWFTW
jgi:hypothetical protein